MNFQHMSAKEIKSHVEKFGTDEQRILVDKLYVDPSDMDWDYCPECEKSLHASEAAADHLHGAIESIEEAIRAL